MILCVTLLGCNGGIIMLNKIYKILNNVPEEEIYNFYCYMWYDEKTCCKEDIIHHIISYMRQYLKNRIFWKENKDANKVLECEIKVHIVFGWLEYLDKRRKK